MYGNGEAQVEGEDKLKGGSISNINSRETLHENEYETTSTPEGNGNEISTNNGYQCRWVNCLSRYHPSLTSLVEHLNSSHLAHIAHLTPVTPIRYTCQWEGCPRLGIEQPSRFALISHCRTHTGEKPYFCPIPECEKHFTRSDALAKHVKGVHDLHSAKDAVSLIKDKIRKNKIAPFPKKGEELNEEEYLRLIEEDYDLKNPWWFSQEFIDIVKDDGSSVESSLNFPLNVKQYKVAKNKYQESGSSDDIENDISEIESLKDSRVLGLLHDSLRQKLNTGLKINKIISKELTKSVKVRRRLWIVNQALIDANIVLGLPNEDNSSADSYKAFFDDDDEELLHEPRINE